MSESELGPYFSCGPSSRQCKCNCPDGPCEHVWDGKEEITEYPEGGCTVSATCSRCGISAFSHSLWVDP